MALINCPECKKRISDTVTACPQCGYAITPEVLNKVKNSRKIGKTIGIGCSIFILVIMALCLIGYLTLKPSLVTGNKVQNKEITNETDIFKGSDNFYYSLNTYKAIGTTNVSIRLSTIDKQGLMSAPYKIYDFDINPDWKGMQLVEGSFPISEFFLYKKGKLNIAFVANDKLLAQKEITIK